MKCSVVRHPIVQAEGDVLIVSHYQDERRFPPPLAQLDRALGGLLRRVFLEEKFEAKPQQLTFVHTAGRLAAKRVMVVGLGRRGEVNTEAVRRAASAAVKRARDIGGKIVSSELLGERLPAKARAQAMIEGALLGSYTFDRYKREKNDKAVEELRIVDPGRRDREIKEG